MMKGSELDWGSQVREARAQRITELRGRAAYYRNCAIDLEAEALDLEMEIGRDYVDSDDAVTVDTA
jgi:hypothetical protein